MMPVGVPDVVDEIWQPLQLWLVLYHGCQHASSQAGEGDMADAPRAPRHPHLVLIGGALMLRTPKLS